MSAFRWCAASPSKVFRCSASMSIPPRSSDSTAGQSHIRHVDAESIAAMRRPGRFDATGDFARLGELDAVILCLPTPLTRHREPDLSFVERTPKRWRRICGVGSRSCSNRPLIQAPPAKSYGLSLSARGCVPAAISSSPTRQNARIPAIPSWRSATSRRWSEATPAQPRRWYSRYQATKRRTPSVIGVFGS
jgi:hypothetical protein